VATVEISPIQSETRTVTKVGAGSFPAISLVLTVLAVTIQGYHPYVEDGGIYLPGIEKILHPELFPTGSSFISIQSSFSQFPRLVAALVKSSGLSLMLVIFLLHVASIWLLIFAAWKVAAASFPRVESRYAAIVLLAVSLSMPIAGTSLMLMDPYLTARSFSTPLSVLAIAGALGIVISVRQSRVARVRDIGLCASSLLLAAVVHPLMAAYAFAAVALLLCMSFHSAHLRAISSIGLSLIAFLFAACLEGLAKPKSIYYAQVARTRTYWFLTSWQWYEKLGLIAPVIVISLLWLRGPARNNVALSAMARMAIAVGLVSGCISLGFAHIASASFAVAELQPLRVFQIVYILMILAIGASLGEWALQRRPWRWVFVFGLLGCMLAFVQAQVFPSSQHLELPGREPSNGWELGFIWIRDHMPNDAVFALDSHYIIMPGEDSQNFRAIAQRSALPDHFKDGGIAAIAPELAATWAHSEAVQHDLALTPDPVRLERLRPASVGWLVLPRDAQTGFQCVFANQSMKVCKVPAR
jgi:hypothetical protein